MLRLRNITKQAVHRGIAMMNEYFFLIGIIGKGYPPPRPPSRMIKYPYTKSRTTKSILRFRDIKIGLIYQK